MPLRRHVSSRSPVIAIVLVFPGRLFVRPARNARRRLVRPHERGVGPPQEEDEAQERSGLPESGRPPMRRYGNLPPRGMMARKPIASVVRTGATTQEVVRAGVGRAGFADRESVNGARAGRPGHDEAVSRLSESPAFHIRRPAGKEKDKRRRPLTPPRPGTSGKASPRCGEKE